MALRPLGTESDSTRDHSCMKVVTACREEFGPARPFKVMLEHNILAASEQKLVSEDGKLNVLFSDSPESKRKRE